MPPRDLVLVLLVVVAWAGNFLTSALAMREIPPFLFTALRFALLALPLVWLVKRPAPGDQWPRLIAVCLCIGVLHFGLSFTALKLAGDLSSPAIVMQSYVPMTTLLAWWWLGERFAWRTGAGDRGEFRRRAGARLRPDRARPADGAGADADLGGVPGDRHGADEGPARPRRGQPAGLDRGVQRAAADGDQRLAGARRDRAAARRELGRAGAARCTPPSSRRCSATACTTCWCNATRSRR